MPDACREYVCSEQKSRPLKGPAFDGFESSNIITPTHTRARQSRSTSSFVVTGKSGIPENLMEKKREIEKEIEGETGKERKRETARKRESERMRNITREREKEGNALLFEKEHQASGFSCTFTLLQPSALSRHIRDPFRLSKSFRKHGCTRSFFAIRNRTNCLWTLLR